MEQSTTPPEEQKKEANSAKDEIISWTTDVFEFKTTFCLNTLSSEQEKASFTSVVSQILLDDPKELRKKDTAKMGFTAYFADSANRHEENQRRPVAFCYNGGPGSASLWLHLGAFGPYRATNLDFSSVDLGKYSTLVENQWTLLNYCDLVFIDPIGTGFSQAKSQEAEQAFFSDKADAKSIAQFIERFLSKYKLWDRDVYLVGESYGGYRSALVAQELLDDKGIYPKGMLLIAPFLSLAANEELPEHVVARTGFFTAFATTAWFHKRSSLNSSCKTAEEAYLQASEFFKSEILLPLFNESLACMPKPLIAKMAGVMGIPADILSEFGDGFSTLHFSQHLFPGLAKYPGRLDSRYTLSHQLEYFPCYQDPAISVLDVRLTQLTNAFLRRTLQATTPIAYCHSGNFGAKWHYEQVGGSAMAALSSVMKKNPHMKIYSAAGYYDLAVPAAGIDYDFKHLNISRELEMNIKREKFEAGHMMYVEVDNLASILEGAASHFLWKKSK